MKQISFIGGIQEEIKHLLLGYQIWGDTYYYRLDPFVVKFQDYQELLVTYLHNLEWMKLILLGVLNTYNEWEQEEVTSLDLDNFYNYCVKIIGKIHKRPQFKNIPLLELGIYSSLFPDLASKNLDWKNFSTKLSLQEQIIKNEIRINKFFPIYDPRYPKERLQRIRKMLDKYKTDFKPVKTYKSLQIQEVQKNLIPDRFFFDPDNRTIFHCLNGVTIKFKGIKKHPYKVFHRLYLAKGRPVSIPVLEKLTGKTGIYKVISILQPKLKGSGLKIVNVPNEGYALIGI